MKPQSRKENIVVQEINNETIVYDLTTNKAYLLNETAAFVWNACDGKNSVSQIGQALAHKTKQTANEDLIWLTIKELDKENLMSEAISNYNPLNGMNRRESLKRIVGTTALVLPVICSIVSPLSVNAASCGSIAAGAAAGTIGIAPLPTYGCPAYPASYMDPICNDSFKNRCQNCQAKYGSCDDTISEVTCVCA